MAITESDFPLADNHFSGGKNVVPGRSDANLAALINYSRTRLSSTSNGLGASLVGVEDSGGYYTGSTVEAVLAQLGSGLVANEITDPGDAGAIPVTRSGSCALTSAAGETRTVADPSFAGQQLNISFDTDGGDIAITFASAINQTGNTVATCADAGDHLLVIGVEIGGAAKWRIVANDGFALS